MLLLLRPALPSHSFAISLRKHSQLPDYAIVKASALVCPIKPTAPRAFSVSTVPKLAAMAHPEASSMQNFMNTSGARDAVWVHKEPYSNRPRFSRLDGDKKTDVCIIGAGITGISSAYELVKRGSKVLMIEAREVISGETGRTSGHLSNAMDDSLVDIAKKHGDKGAKIAAESHTWALKHVGEVAKELHIECEYRLVPDYEVPAAPRGDPGHSNELQMLKDDADKAKELDIPAEFRENYAIKGWDGQIDQRGLVVFKDNATFHPTQYLVGVLKWLAKQPNFECYTHTRMASLTEKGLLTKHVEVTTADGHTIKCKDAIEATCIPLQKLSIVAEVEYYRTYCIAARIPKGSYEDCLINDQGDPYHYVRFTECNEKEDYIVVGGCDHKVGQAQEGPQFEHLEKWTRERFTYIGSVDYKWSGQTLYSTDLVQYIGKNQGQSHTYVASGDTGHGLTMGLIAGRLFADSIYGVESPWNELYSPKRFPPVSSIPDMVMHYLQINSQYKRFAESDIEDIGQLPNNEGAILNSTAKKPLAIYKDENGNVSKYSAICPHLKGVLCWNHTEKSFDCPIHGSRFSKEGICIMGPALMNLPPESEESEARQKAEEKAG